MSRPEAGDRLLVSFIDRPDQDGFHGDDWPYHVTLLPWYNVAEAKLENWHQQLEKIAEATTAFEVEVGEEDYFGKHHDVLVRRLALAAFRPLHFRLLNTLTDKKSGFDGALLDDSFVGRDYQPHITQKYTELMSEGQKLSIASISEVVKIESGFGGYDREIIADYPLKEAVDETAA